MNVVFSALILAASIIIAAILLKPDPAAGQVYKQPDTCTLHSNGKIIFQPCQ
ncbi:hypothetical protein [Pantoea ananatis]|uniref:hypothetical protein n=1 Tax=Pantoea ananas TaxID=553 RepID=UPI001B30E67B|nr:hypothetical protein [Pantoea ananatis]